MRAPLTLIFALIVEVFLLLLVLLVLLIGILGIFLPILPGLLIIGIAMGLYSLLVNSKHSRITPRLHRRLLIFKDIPLFLKIIDKSMGIIKAIKKKRESKAREEILKNGLILFGFNVALILAFIFGFIGLSIVGDWVDQSGVLAVFFPMVVIFIFAGFSAIVWYRFGQILHSRFKNRLIVNAALTVLVSLLPMFALLLMVTAIFGLAGGFYYEFISVFFLGLILMSVLSASFELLVVSLGIITRGE